jgi:DNA-binding XRE family transcriptional regulator
MRSEDHPRPPSQFEASVSQLKYLFAMQEAVAELRPTATAMAKLLNISRQTIYAWK